MSWTSKLLLGVLASMVVCWLLIGANELDPTKHEDHAGLAVGPHAAKAHRCDLAWATSPHHAHHQRALQALRPLRRDGRRRRALAADHQAAKKQHA